MLLALLIFWMTWDPLPPGTAIDYYQASAWMMVQTFYPCGEEEPCLSYSMGWSATETVGPLSDGIEFTVPDFPSGAVIFIPLLVRTGRLKADGEVCWSGP